MTGPLLSDPHVAVARDTAAYPRTPPFHPSEAYPEWQGAAIGTEDNPAFRAVRACFVSLGLDATNAGTAAWNPLRDLVQPGATVVVKPNLVSHRNMGDKAYGLTDTDSLVTHGSVLRAVADYAARALDGKGTLVIGDCPVQGSRWDEIVALTGLQEIASYLRTAWPQLTVRVEDFRLGTAVVVGERIVSRSVDESRRGEYTEVDVGRDSMLVPLMTGDYAFGVAQYPQHRMRRAHTPERNLYLVPNTFLDADLLINVAKLKAHMKAGITCSMKNLVGINGHKDYLPHFRLGSPRQGGDEYPDGNWLSELMWWFMHAEWNVDRGWRKTVLFYAGIACYSLLRYVYRYPRGYASLGGGSWHGNDTAWRMVLDINRAFFYWDRGRGAMSESMVRGTRYLALVDGIVGGHRESPLAPTPYPAGLMIAGRNPAAVDATATALMGFDWRRVRQVAGAFAIDRFPLADFGIGDVQVAGIPGVSGIDDIYSSGQFHRFEPSRGYVGHLEYRHASPAPGAPADPSTRDEIDRGFAPA